MEYLAVILTAAFDVVTDYSKPGFWLWWLSVVLAACRGERTRPRRSQPVEKVVTGTTIRPLKNGRRIS